MSRYCNKDIKVISALAIFVTLCQLWKWFLPVQKTLKTTIQKTLRKSQKFARKISAAEFRYSQTIFLRFTLTLFHSNLNERIPSNEQKVTTNEQKVTRNGQRTKVHPPFQHGFKPFTLYLQKLELLNICDAKFVSIICCCCYRKHWN